MRLGKTGKARLALDAVKAGGLDLRDRRILILADGKRTRAELQALLGADSGASIDRLVREGYLEEEGAAAQLPDPVPTPMSPRVATSTRRSIVAAKMYLIDMLQLQRSPTAVELRLAIQSTSEPAALLDRLLDALHYLVGSTPPSYGERVLARFAEVVPEEALPRLPALAA